MAAARKEWKEELTLYTQLTMAHKGEKMKLNLFHNLAGVKDREVSSTLFY